MDCSGAEFHQVGVGGQVRSAEDSSLSEQTNSEFHGISGTARSPTRDSQEAAQSASQQRASPRSEILFQSVPGSSTPQNTGTEVEKKGRRQQQTFSSKQQASPRRFKSRLARTLASGPHCRRGAEELERSRWVHNLTVVASSQARSRPVSSWEQVSVLQRCVATSGTSASSWPGWPRLTRRSSPPATCSTSSTCKSGSRNRRTEEPSKTVTLLSSFSRRLPDYQRGRIRLPLSCTP